MQATLTDCELDNRSTEGFSSFDSLGVRWVGLSGRFPKRLLSCMLRLGLPRNVGLGEIRSILQYLFKICICL